MVALINAVSFSLDLGLDLLHLVAIEGVADIATDIDESHDCGIGFVYLSLSKKYWFCSLFEVEFSGKGAS